jgi:hypothetical protein
MNIYKESIVTKKLLLESHYKNPPNLNTEVWLNRNKKDLVIVVGESWSWGDSMGGQHALGIDNTEHRINNNLGIYSAIKYDSDFCLCALPGGNNVNIALSLRRLLNEVAGKYDTVRCIIQLTEPSRDFFQLGIKGYWLLNYEIPFDFTYRGFFQEIIKDPISIQAFYSWYERRLETLYNSVLDKHSNVKYIFWKNFTRWIDRPYKNAIDISMVEHLSLLKNDPIIPPVDLSSYYWETLIKTFYDWVINTNINPFDVYKQFTPDDMSFINKELNKTLNYFNWQRKYNNILFKVTHPNEDTHKLWGEKIINSGILDD